MVNQEHSEMEILIKDYSKIFEQHADLEKRVKKYRMDLNAKSKLNEKIDSDLKALQNVGQLIGEILKKVSDEHYIVKLSSGPHYIVGCKERIPRSKLKIGARVALEISTLTIMSVLPREVDPTIYHMLNEDPGLVNYTDIGGLDKQIRDVRETVELPLTSPGLFKRVGIKAPKGVLLYGPPGNGKTLIARAMARQIDANFMKVASSSIVHKYIGESSRIIREMFAYAREHSPCIVFMDEIDAIGGRRISEGNFSDREIQRTLMELLNQLDGFNELGQVKIIMATNRPDVLDPALLRPGRIDRKILIPLPNETARSSIFKIHAGKLNKKEKLDLESIVRLSDGFNGADIRNVCTEAGLGALRAERDFVTNEDMMKACRKIKESKKLESVIEFDF